jgi:1,4-dihydroxy-2-naphthoate octaprenyltransferase
MEASSKIKAWLSAARLRTLPLSISGILVGSAYAYLSVSNYSYLIYKNDIDFSTSRIIMITALALLTTLGFQVLSNFANDYGDGVKGTDNNERLGPMRAVQSGIITSRQMKKAVIITAILSLIVAVFLIYYSLGLEQMVPFLIFLVLGIAAVWAAIKYTVGDNAYGYSGLGDLFVFIFFGPVSIFGVYYLIIQEIDFLLMFPSICIGLLSVAVLNLNNMRDIDNDRLSGKNTIVVKLGLEKAKKLHSLIVISAIVSNLISQILLIVFAVLSGVENQFFTLIIILLPSLIIIPLIKHLKIVRSTESSVLLDPELKKVALSTFASAILTLLSFSVITNYVA